MCLSYYNVPDDGTGEWNEVEISEPGGPAAFISLSVSIFFRLSLSNRSTGVLQTLSMARSAGKLRLGWQSKAYCASRVGEGVGNFLLRPFFARTPALGRPQQNSPPIATTLAVGGNQSLLARGNQGLAGDKR